MTFETFIHICSSSPPPSTIQKHFYFIFRFGFFVNLFKKFTLTDFFGQIGKESKAEKQNQFLGVESVLGEEGKW